jgi:GrpB-like predicted nucleotidyltransferase (UPF0157 family)
MSRATPGARLWDDWLLFRDYLRAHPETAQAYADLKKALAAASGDDIERYRTGKHEFVTAVTATARAATLRPSPPASGR